MIKINLITKEVTRETLPKFLVGLKQESLNDLSWTDEALGLQGFGFWQEVNVTSTYDATYVLDGNETFNVNVITKLVEVTKGVRLKTEEELLAEFKATVPQIISMRQARLALIQSGLYDAINTAIKTMSPDIQVEWEYATEVKRSYGLILGLAEELGLTERELDELFVLGATL